MTIAITAETPISSITISGHSFKVPEPYAEGHVLDANEASTLNQTYAENVRNNYASKVAAAVDAAKVAGAPAIDLEKLQSDLNDYVKDYAFGVRRGGGTGDPVEREALDAARELVKTKIREKSLKLSDYKAADITEKAKQVLDKYPQIREQAKARVEAAQAAAASLVTDIEV